MVTIKQPGVSNVRGRCRVRYRSKQYPVDEVTDFPYTQAGVDEAARYLQKRKQEVRRDGLQERLPSAPIFAVAAQTYLDRSGLAPGSRRASKGLLENYWMDGLADTPIDDIQPRHLRLLLAETHALSAKSRRNILSVASAVFRRAVADGILESNPARDIEIPREKARKKPDPFTKEERDNILQELSGNLRAYWAIRFLAGLRPGEVLALRWPDYAPQARTLSVSKQITKGVLRDTTKTHEPRVVATPDRLAVEIARIPRQIHTDYLLVNQYGQHYTSAEEMNRPFLKVMDKLGIRYRSPYNARHTCATVMLEAGLEPAYIAKQLGHSIQMLLTTYADWVNDDRDAQQRELLERYL